MGRFIYLALALWAGAFLFLQASGLLYELLPTGDVRRLARALERETQYRQSLVERGEPFGPNSWIDGQTLAAVTASTSMKAAEGSCLADVSRGALEVRLGALDQALLAEGSDRDIRRLRADADGAVMHRLACAPTDGNAWLLRAQLLSERTDDMATVAKLLDLSYFYAPAEKWIMIPRLRLVGNLIDAGDLPMPAQHALDLDRVLSLSAPNDVAELYVDAGIRSRALMRAVIDRQRLDRRVRILRLIDALGVSYPVPDVCRSTVRNGSPGSELELRRPADLVAACER